jgi:hypothetical protein
MDCPNAAGDPFADRHPDLKRILRPNVARWVTSCGKACFAARAELWHASEGVGRFKRGVTVDQARADLLRNLVRGRSRRTRENRHPHGSGRAGDASGMTLVAVGAAAGLIAGQFTARLLQCARCGRLHDWGCGRRRNRFLANYIPRSARPNWIPRTRCASNDN